MTRRLLAPSLTSFSVAILALEAGNRRRETLRGLYHMHSCMAACMCGVKTYCCKTSTNISIASQDKPDYLNALDAELMGLAAVDREVGDLLGLLDEGLGSLLTGHGFLQVNQPETD